MKNAVVLFLILLFRLSPEVMAQDSKGQNSAMNLTDVLDYALKNSPMIQQSGIDQQIGERQIKSSLSGWLPQISTNYQVSNNLKLQTQPIGDQLITFGQPFASNLIFEVNQTLFNRDQFFLLPKQLDSYEANSANRWKPPRSTRS
ncbi:TolC family protein [Algoriphagus boritolerans]|uniref:TolC family protein n=1 Tax=Algoriphagus boritolerans TaxID=308111 RepID=UPI000AF9A7C0